MNIKKLIDSLDLIYYDYDAKEKILIKDSNYSNKIIESEFFKITYYLTKNHISFTVLKNRSIKFSKKKFEIKKYISNIFENIKKSNQNIFLLNDKKVKWAKNIPLFKINYTRNEINLDNYDALIFSSQNAVNAVDSINKKWKKIPSYVMSKQTAKLVKSLNGKLEYIGKTKHGNEFANEISESLKGKRVLYLRAKEVVSDLINILNQNGVICEDEIIYENQFNESVKRQKIPKDSKIIFTSPSTVNYFFKIFTWDESYTAISIGNTTAKYFPEDIKPVIADDTSFQSCVDKSLSLS